MSEISASEMDIRRIRSQICDDIFLGDKFLTDSELAPLTIDAAAEAPPVSADVADELEKESEEAQEINEQVAHEAGFVIDNFRPANTNA